MIGKMNFYSAMERLKDTSYKSLPDKVHIQITNASEHLKGGLKFFCGNGYYWNEDYSNIANWLTDNKGKGLMLVGGCGVGKTLIGMRIIPLLLNHYCRKVVTICTANELNKTPDEIMRNHIIYIDDVGTEDVSNIYGNKRVPFAELVDIAERDGKLLIFSTNLDDEHLKAKYGDRVVDRLHAIVRKITITGKSNRK
ncbi:MAG: hypothetical protein ACTTI4_00645 [Prevotella fusca]|uniref:nSTAND3 domain-containing NTPase n=1 Tax=Prevotella fusca TaxID=589436 RepID=UPI003F9F41CA